MIEQVRKLWVWFEWCAKSPYALVFLFVYSFVETLITLLPIDPFVVAVMLADRSRTYYIAGVITVGSLFGAIVGYWIGWGAFSLIGSYLLYNEHSVQIFANVQEIFNANAALITFTTAFVPIPKTPTILAAGFLHAEILVFALAWLVGRALHFFGEAVIVRMSIGGDISRTLRIFAIASVAVVLVTVGWVAVAFSGIA